METLKFTVHSSPVREYSFDNTYFVDEKCLVIGSGKASQIVISDASIDLLHAMIVRKNHQYYLADLDTTKGTRLGAAKLQPKQGYLLSSGSLIQVGNVIIEVKITTTKTTIVSPSTTPTQVINSKFSTKLGFRLDAINLKKSSRPLFGTTLINNISLSILPREFVVIAGVSGGGKSTLMDALNGQRRARGKVLVNGSNLYTNFGAFKDKVGYVPQDDIVHPELSVVEALSYAARLRLPSQSPAQRQQRVQEVLEQLQLTQRQNVPIGRLSGGQRKRVSIGVELISNPRLFFLDEATSGLDPGTELQIMELLRSLANAGSTVLLITHATKNVEIADMVIFLAKGGRLAYFGPSKLALQYFKVQDFDAIYNKVERQFTPQEWERYFVLSGYYKKFISDRLETIPENNSPSAKKPDFNEQLTVLCQRNLNILFKNRVSLALIILGAPILGSLNFALWKSDLFSTKTGNAGQAITMLFVTVIMAVMSGALATMPEIAKEKAIFHRERSAGLGVLPYIASKLHLAFVLALYQSLVLLSCMVLAVNIPQVNNIVVGMYCSLFLASFGSMVLGLLVSAISPSQSVAPLLTIVVLVPQVVFGGGILPVNEFHPVGKAINQVMLTKYPF